MNPQRASRRVLGVDPGYDRLGLAILEGDPSRPTLPWSACIEPPKGTRESRLAAVYTAVEQAIKQHKPDALAIETLFFSKNISTGIPVAEARGAILAAAGNAKVPTIEISPQHVKLAVTGYGASDKRAIARMIPLLVALPKGKHRDDELDAIAVGIAGLAQMSTIA